MRSLKKRVGKGGQKPQKSAFKPLTGKRQSLATAGKPQPTEDAKPKPVSDKTTGLGESLLLIEADSE